MLKRNTLPIEGLAFLLRSSGHMVKHGLDSLVKHGLDSKAPISKTWTGLV